MEIHNGKINVSTSCSVQPNPAWAAYKKKNTNACQYEAGQLAEKFKGKLSTRPELHQLFCIMSVWKKTNLETQTQNTMYCI